MDNWLKWLNCLNSETKEGAKLLEIVQWSNHLQLLRFKKRHNVAQFF